MRQIRVRAIQFASLLCFALVKEASAAKETKYPISEISAELKENAKAVIRLEKREFELLSDSKATEKITLAISVLNENGLAVADFAEYYNKFLQIGHISAAVYDENGTFMHRIKQDDILDIGVTSPGTLYDDSRVKMFEPKTRDYPFTVEYSYEIAYDGIFFFPIWQLQKDYNISVEQAQYKIISPEKEAVRILSKNMDEPLIIEEDGKFVRTWTLTDYKARNSEPFSELVSEYTPSIRMAPNFINFGGIKRDFNSWDDFGSFFSELNKGRGELPLKTIQQVREIAKSASSISEKVRFIYEYMQSKTRYVGIQEGIGGWQPILASDVDRLGYGDCKALTNYMKALLEGVGIKSFYTLVGAGSQALTIDDRFPCNQFNHAILCVPIEKDTIWLECTSQSSPCGYIGTFTDDRDVLLIDGNCGKVVHTKSYLAIENRMESQIEVNIDEAGNAQLKSNTKYSGVQYDKIAPLLQMDQKDREKYMADKIKAPNFSLNGFSHQEFKERIPFVLEKMNLDLGNYGSRVGNRMIIGLNVLNKQQWIPVACPSRESDVLIRRPLLEKDTVVYAIPVGYELDKIPAPVTIYNRFGSYQAKVEVIGGQIVYVREFSVVNGNFPPESYAELKSFLAEVSNADMMKCMLIKRE